jgi:small subunit ribosomal protein S9
MSAKDNAAKYYYGVGRRKASTVRAKYYPTTKPVQITINGKPGNEYFNYFYYQTLTNALSKAAVSTGDFHLFARSGGTRGQADACRLAMSKALLTFDESYRVILRLNGFLTTDNRKVLPKKSGLRKARKAEQWSKR